MSHHSPPSSVGAGTSSSPFTGTDATLYSPEVTRHARLQHQRDDISQVTIVGSSKLALHAIDLKTSKGKGKLKATLIYPAPYVQGSFVNELAEDDKNYISRYQLVAQLPDGTHAGQDSEHELYTIQHQMKLYACFSSCVPIYARGVYLRHDDFHDAAEAKDILEQHDFVIEYVSSYEYAVAKSEDTAQINEFEGQIQLPVAIDVLSNQSPVELTAQAFQDIKEHVEGAISSFGAVRNCMHVDTVDEHNLAVFRVEFHSVDAGNRAVQSLRADPIWGTNLEKTHQWYTVGPSPWTGERALNSPHRTKPRIDDQGRLAEYRAAPNHLQGFSRHPHDQHNRVRRERILDGSDVRTTVMLRNIPNKLDWLSLKAQLDQKSFGTFDFMYLRIDFKTGSNVGYAFINFADVNGMIALLDGIEGRPWVGFRSAKAAEISYATIQGREALIQKFRNSSVMQETPFCRPRLFLTYMDTDYGNQLRNTGTEQIFPRPDNLSKLQRSIDSARSVGLYPPHGALSGMEHRSRSSVYDRGTPRDTNSTVMAHQRPNPASVAFTSFSPAQKRDIELWYHYAFGQGSGGTIPFNYIPTVHVKQYFDELEIQEAVAVRQNASAWLANNPIDVYGNNPFAPSVPMMAPMVAPIAAPIVASSSATTAASAVTPTRESRNGRNPGRAIGMKGNNTANKNPFN